MANNSDTKNGRLLPFTPMPQEPRRAPTERDVLAVAVNFMEWQRAKAARIAATPPPAIRPKQDRRRQ